SERPSRSEWWPPIRSCFPIPLNRRPSRDHTTGTLRFRERDTGTIGTDEGGQGHRASIAIGGGLTNGCAQECGRVWHYRTVACVECVVGGRRRGTLALLSTRRPRAIHRRANI